MNSDLDTTEPTDPEVYNRSEQSFRQREPIYDCPRPTPHPVPAPDDIREILDDLVAYEQQRLRDNNTRITSSYDTFGTPTTTTTTATTNITGDPLTTASESTRTAASQFPSPPAASTPSTVSAPESQIPGTHQHSNVGIAAPIPQGSPPVTPLRSVRPPPYYRDYLNPDVAQAYHFICQSAWYIQVSATTIYCDSCATAEHIFCERQVSPVWRHLHIISRHFQNTTLHCGRCYNLLLRTRRAIDCFHCRQHIMDNIHRVNHLITQILCDVTIFP